MVMIIKYNNKKYIDDLRAGNIEFTPDSDIDKDIIRIKKPYNKNRKRIKNDFITRK